MDKTCHLAKKWQEDGSTAKKINSRMLEMISAVTQTFLAHL